LATVALGLLMLAGSTPVLAGPFGVQSVHGRYTTSFLGFQSASPENLPAAESGALVSDGNGNLSGFLNWDFAGFVATCSITGTYTVGTAPIGDTDGFVTLNLQFPNCATVSCPGTDAPACAAGSTFVGLPEQEWCALSDPAGKSLDCTLMGEIGFPSNPNTQTLIFPTHWAR